VSLKRWWKHRRKTVVIVASAILILVVGSLLLKWLGFDSNAVAAVASALAAIAAFASARESSSTARDAMRALSLSSKPEPRLECWDDDDQLKLVIRNESTHPIARAQVSWKLRDGQRGTKELGTLAGIRIASQGLNWGNEGPMYPHVILTPYPGRIDGVDEVTLDYWGTNGPMGWRLTQTFNHIYTTGSLPDGTGTRGWSVASPSKTETELI
jgi:hypothetical protein